MRGEKKTKIKKGREEKKKEKNEERRKAEAEEEAEKGAEAEAEEGAEGAAASSYADGAGQLRARAVRHQPPLRDCASAIHNDGVSCGESKQKKQKDK